jgi:2-haloacid dehalogenase
MAAKDHVQALLFDVFGTVVDWRSSIIAELTRFGADKGISADWTAFTDDWRGLYQPAMEGVRSGRRPWTILDVLHRESLEALLAKSKITTLSEAEKDHINRAWHRLEPWPGTA